MLPERPVVAVDVDGVLFPYLSPAHGGWLLQLADRADLMWATYWEEDANHVIGPTIGLPELPVIAMALRTKYECIQEAVAGRPVAFIDDFFADGAGSQAWVSSRKDAGLRTLLVPVNPAEGLQYHHIEAVSRWLDAPSR